MPTTKMKADTFVREMAKHESEELKRLGIDRQDVSVQIRVEVTDSVRYNNHEDED